MPDRAALVTGASSGIGFAIARMLGEDGYGLTLAARRPEKLADAAARLRRAARRQRARRDPLLPGVRRPAARRRAEHRNALVVDMSSISGKSGQAWLSVYSARKAAVIGSTQAMNKQLNGDRVKSVALCPGFVDTPMTEFVRDHVPAGADDQARARLGSRPISAPYLALLCRPGDRVPAAR